MLVGTESEARQHVRRLKGRGVHFIKAYASLSWSLHRAVADEARRQSLPIVAHGDDAEEMIRGVTLGYRVFEHGSQRFHDDVLQMLASSGTYWDPTRAVIGGNELLLRSEPERLSDPLLLAFNSDSAIQHAQSGSFLKNLSDQALRGFWSEQLGGIGDAYRRGVKLLSGTDVPVGNTFAGSSLHWEPEYLAEAGITPLEVLRIATRQSAESLGAENDLGTLESGKLADIVILDSNPLNDIKNTQTVWRVIRGGWLFDPEELATSAGVRN